jgi:DNA-binding NarL/FixJ family response regulator
MVIGPPPARPTRVAVVDSDPSFAAVAVSGLRFADGLEVVAIAPAPIDVVDRLVVWRADIVVLDLHLYGPETGHPLVTELKGRGIDVVLTTDDPPATIVDHCPVHDKARARTSLYALVEAVRRHRQAVDVLAD